MSLPTLSPSQANWEVFKVPLGFIRVLELPFILMTFWPVSRFSADIVYKTADCGSHNLPITYPFRFDQMLISPDSCNKTATQFVPLFDAGESFVFSSRFFVWLGYLSLFIVLASLCFYVFRWHHYEHLAQYAALDFCATCLYTALWVLSTIAWAFTLSSIKTHLMPVVIKAHILRDAACREPYDPCVITEHLSYAGLNISVIAGLACMITFGANIWFVFKETSLFKFRDLQTYQEHLDRQNGGGAMVGSPVHDDLDQLEFDDSIYD